MFALLPGYVGAYASAALVPEAALARIPEGMSFEQAAALPLVALTACQVGCSAVQPEGIAVWSTAAAAAQDGRKGRTLLLPARHANALCRCWRRRACRRAGACSSMRAREAWGRFSSR